MDITKCSKATISLQKSYKINNVYEASTVSKMEFLRNELISPDAKSGTLFKKSCNKTVSKCKEDHACSTCGKEFKRKANLISHTATHLKVKPFPCLICTKGFSRKDHLKNHCNIHLQNGWCCYFCGKLFPQRCILRTHEMIHREIKPYKCEICDSRFTRKNDMIRHTTSHTEEKIYLCEVCKKGFTQNRLLKRHLRRHTKKN